MLSQIVLMLSVCVCVRLICTFEEKFVLLVQESISTKEIP